MAPFFYGSNFIARYGTSSIRSNKLISRDQYQALRLATVVHVDGIVFDRCWKFYPKSLVKIISVGVGTSFSKTDV